MQSSDAKLYTTPSCINRILDRKAPSKSSYHVEPSQRPLSICQVRAGLVPLLCAAWPAAARGKDHGQLRRRTDESTCAQTAPALVLFWGLNVRMAVTTGTVENAKVTLKRLPACTDAAAGHGPAGRLSGPLAQVNPHTKTIEYAGEAPLRLKALTALPHGGQILIDSATFSAASHLLLDIKRRLPATPDYAAMRTNKCARARRQPS